MATEVFVHIGPPKTGTTYLQRVLWRNRALLREAGVLYPGLSPVTQFHAAVDLVDRDRTGLGPDRVERAWERLAEQVRDWPGVAVLSHENLGFATATEVVRARRSLGATRLHVVHTPRAPHLVAPAAWQERLKNREPLTWPQFMRRLRRQDSPFWWQHGGQALHAWADGLEPGDVHVVVVPPALADPSLLWQRFAQAAGLDDLEADLDVPASNPSVGVEGAAYLRRVSRDLGDEVDWATYRAGVKHTLTPALAARADDPPVVVAGEDADYLRTRATALVESLAAPGYHVIGDLDELLVPDDLPAADDPANRPHGRQSHVPHQAVLGMIRVLGQPRQDPDVDPAETRPSWTAERVQLRARISALEAELQTEREEARRVQEHATRSVARIAAGRLVDRWPALRRWRERRRGA